MDQICVGDRNGVGKSRRKSRAQIREMGNRAHLKEWRWFWLDSWGEAHRQMDKDRQYMQGQEYLEADRWAGEGKQVISLGSLGWGIDDTRTYSLQAPDIHPPCVATRHSSRTWVPPCTCARPSPTVCLMTPGPASSGATCCMRWAPTCWPSAAFSGPPSSCALPLAPRPTTRSSTERAGDSPGLCLHA